MTIKIENLQEFANLTESETQAVIGGHSNSDNRNLSIYSLQSARDRIFSVDFEPLQGEPYDSLSIRDRSSTDLVSD